MERQNQRKIYTLIGAEPRRVCIGNISKIESDISLEGFSVPKEVLSPKLIIEMEIPVSYGAMVMLLGVNEKKIMLELVHPKMLMHLKFYME